MYCRGSNPSHSIPNDNSINWNKCRCTLSKLWLPLFWLCYREVCFVVFQDRVRWSQSKSWEDCK